MKRLIALVLSLVMALSLCAPAWGAGETVDPNNITADCENLPVAKVTVLGNDYEIDTTGSKMGADLGECELDVAYQFEPTETVEQAEESDYRYWHADFVVYANKNVPDNSMALAGYYKAWCSYNDYKWVALTNDGLPIDANEEVRLVYGMGSGAISVNYEELCEYGNDGTGFQCGVADMTGSNAGTTITVELRLYETEEPSESNGNSHNVETGRYAIIATHSYTFDGAVAEVNGVGYATLAEAIAVGGTVTLLDNITLTESVTVAADNTVVLDLNGKTLSYTATEAKATCAIDNKGTLTITNGTVTYKGVGDPNFGYGTNTINNTGKLTIDGATIINTTDSGSSVAIDCSAGANLIVESGTIESQKNAIRLCPFGAAAINCTINGGTITGARAIQIQLPSNKPADAPDINLTVNDGTLNGTTGLSIYSYSAGQSFANVDVTLKGGIYNNDVAFGGGNAKTTEENVVITGGTYYGELGRYLANDGWEDLAPVTVGSVSYATLQDAVDAVADKGTITVKVAGQSAVVSTAKTFTVEGEKATITAGSGYVLSEKDGVYTVTKYVAPYYPPVVDTTPDTPAETPAETPSQSTESTTPTTPSTPTVEVTVPVGGNENTVKVEASVTGTTAKVDKVGTAVLESVIGDDVDTGKVTIDFSTVTPTTGAVDSNGEIVEAAPVDTVEIPAEVIAEIAEAVANPENNAESLEIVLGDGASIEFDAAALAEKVAQAGGDDITVSIKPTTAVAETLSQAQIFTVGESVAFDITVTSGGVAISDMGGEITISAPYELGEGESAEGIVVYYVDDAGNKEACETVYDAATGRVSWKTNHLSVYMVAYEAPAADDGAVDDGAADSETPAVDDAQGGSPVLWIVIAVVVIVAIVVAVVVSKKRKN